MECLSSTAISFVISLVQIAVEILIETIYPHVLEMLLPSNHNFPNSRLTRKFSIGTDYLELFYR